MEIEIASGRLPVGGLKDLQKACQQEMDWAETVVTLPVICEFVYKRFMSLFYACMYCFSPQGRIGGIESLQFKQRKELLRKHHTQSTEFKTDWKYGFQSVLLDNQYCNKLFTIYINFLRPKVCISLKIYLKQYIICYYIFIYNIPVISFRMYSYTCIYYIYDLCILYYIMYILYTCNI